MRAIKVTVHNQGPPDIEYLIKVLAELFMETKKADAATSTSQK